MLEGVADAGRLGEVCGLESEMRVEESVVRVGHVGVVARDEGLFDSGAPWHLRGDMGADRVGEIDTCGRAGKAEPILAVSGRSAGGCVAQLARGVRARAAAASESGERRTLLA